MPERHVQAADRQNGMKARRVAGARMRTAAGRGRMNRTLAWPERRNMTHAALGSDAVGPRMALAREWEELVAQVRALDGFEDFLRPPRLEKLLPAAERGPVVIVNMSRWRCDALIVRRDGVIRATSFPASPWTRLRRAADGYLSVLSDAEAADLRCLAAAAGPRRDTSAMRPGDGSRPAGTWKRRTSGSTRCWRTCRPGCGIPSRAGARRRWATPRPRAGKRRHGRGSGGARPARSPSCRCTRPADMAIAETAGRSSTAWSPRTPRRCGRCWKAVARHEQRTAGRDTDRLLFVDVPDLPGPHADRQLSRAGGAAAGLPRGLAAGDRHGGGDH